MAAPRTVGARPDSGVTRIDDRALAASMSRVSEISSRMHTSSEDSSRLSGASAVTKSVPDRSKNQSSTRDSRDAMVDSVSQWVGVWQINGHSRWNGEYMIIRRRQHQVPPSHHHPLSSDSSTSVSVRPTSLSLETFDPRNQDKMFRFVVDRNPLYACWIYVSKHGKKRRYNGKMRSLDRVPRIEWTDPDRKMRVDDWVRKTPEHVSWLSSEWPKISSQKRTAVPSPSTAPAWRPKGKTSALTTVVDESGQSVMTERRSGDKSSSVSPSSSNEWTEKDLKSMSEMNRLLKTEPAVMHGSLVGRCVEGLLNGRFPDHAAEITSELMNRLTLEQTRFLIRDKRTFFEQSTAVFEELQRSLLHSARKGQLSMQPRRDSGYRTVGRDRSQGGGRNVSRRVGGPHDSADGEYSSAPSRRPIKKNDPIWDRKALVAKHFSGPRRVVRGGPIRNPKGEMMPRLGHGGRCSVRTRQHISQMVDTPKRRYFYEDYLDQIVLEKGIEKGLIFVGELSISRSNPVFGFVKVKGFEKEIRVISLRHRNRAFDGDTVAVSMYPLSEWLPDMKQDLIEFEARVQDLENKAGASSSGEENEDDTTDKAEDEDGMAGSEDSDDDDSSSVPKHLKAKKRTRFNRLEDPSAVTAMEVELGKKRSKESDVYPKNPDCEEYFAPRGKVMAIVKKTQKVKNVDGWIQPQYVGRGRDRALDTKWAFFVPFNTRMPKAKIALFRSQVPVIDALLHKHADWELGSDKTRRMIEKGLSLSDDDNDEDESEEDEMEEDDVEEDEEDGDEEEEEEQECNDEDKSSEIVTTSKGAKWIRRTRKSSSASASSSDNKEDTVVDEQTELEVDSSSKSSKKHESTSELKPSEAFRQRMRMENGESRNPVTQELKNLIVEVEYERQWHAKDTYPYCHMIAVLGERGQMEVETKIILNNHNISHTREFSKEIEEYVSTLGVKEEDYENRLDIRDEFVITIDPTTARDFDDAISFKQIGKGLYRVGIHIADVTHFVKDKTALDDEARSRATSVYLVDRCLPMLPEALSNGLCSLNPCEDRLCYSVFVNLNSKGEVVYDPDYLPPDSDLTSAEHRAKSRSAVEEAIQAAEEEKTGMHEFTDSDWIGPTNSESPWFGRTVIHSCARLNYETAQKFIETPLEECTESLLDECCTLKSGTSVSTVAKNVKLLWKLAKHRRDVRFERGSVAFARTSVRFRLNPDNHEALLACPDSSMDSNRLVEDYMLLANQLVARHLVNHLRGRAVLRRHPVPDPKRSKNATLICRSQDISIDMSSSLRLNQSLQRLQGKMIAGDIDVLEIVSTIALMSMARAEYFCVENNPPLHWRHWGLCFDTYTHFTSPIRRYADVLVHRQLTEVLSSGKVIDAEVSEIDGDTSVNELDPGQLDEDKEQCTKCNKQSKRAADAEVDSRKVHLCLLLKDRIVYADAIITEMKRKWVTVIIHGFAMRCDVKMIHLEGCIGHIEGSMPDCRFKVAWDSGEEEDYGVFDKVRVKLYSKIQTPIELVCSLVAPERRDECLPFTLGTDPTSPFTVDTDRTKSEGVDDITQGIRD